MHPDRTEVVKLFIQKNQNRPASVVAIDEKGDVYELKSTGYETVEATLLDE